MKYYIDQNGDSWIRFRCPGVCRPVNNRKGNIVAIGVNNHKNIGTPEKPTLVGKKGGEPLKSGSSLGIDQVRGCSCHPFLVDGVFVDKKGNKYPTLELLEFE